MDTRMPKAEGTSAAYPDDEGRGLTRYLAAFTSQLSFDDLPAEAVAKLRMCLFDTIACVVLGNSLDQVKTLMAGMQPEFPEGPARVWGTSIATSPGMSALINGTAGHAFQFDEVHTGAVLHPGPAIFPALIGMAAASKAPISGKQFLEAAAGGYELGVRAGLAFDGDLFRNGWHAQGVLGPVAAAAAGARMKGLDLEKTLYALGIAASTSTGIMAVQRGSNTKSFHSGRAAQGAVYATDLAAVGFTGVDDPLDPGYGLLFDAFTSGKPGNSAAQALGEKWHLLDVSFKLSPASNGSLSGSEALGNILEEHGISADEIETITAHVSENTLHHCGWKYVPSPENSPLAAQMSLRYGMAVRAIDGHLGPKQMLQPRISDADIAAFLPKIAIEVEPKYDAPGSGLRLAARVELTCKDGRSFSSEVLYRKGTSQQPATEDEIEDKFHRLLAPVFSAEQIETICATLKALESCDDVRGLIPGV